MAWVLVAITLATGCSEYECIGDESTAHAIASYSFGYDEEVKFTFWFNDGGQKETFERDHVPENARGAVLAEFQDQTLNPKNGAVVWAADLSDDAGAKAYYVPAAVPRAAAYAGWSGAWAAGWIGTRSAVWSEELLRYRKARAARGGAEPEPEKKGALDPSRLLGFLKGSDPEQVDEELEIDAVEAMDAVKGDPAPPNAMFDEEELAALEASDPKKMFMEEGISVEALKLGRATRSVGAMRPTPQDFGLSVEVHQAWLFVSKDCKACSEAADFLTEQGIGYHAMLVDDPTNARVLADLSTRAGIEKPAVPTLWRHNELHRGFSSTTWSAELR